jgi:hypothetical protein
LAALGTALGPEPLTSWYAIVSEHHDRAFQVKANLASRSWRALRPEKSKSRKLHSTMHARKPLARSEQPGGPRRQRDIIVWFPREVARARTARGRLPQPLKHARRASLACL